MFGGAVAPPQWTGWDLNPLVTMYSQPHSPVRRCSFTRVSKVVYKERSAGPTRKFDETSHR